MPVPSVVCASWVPPSIGGSFGELVELDGGLDLAGLAVLAYCPAFSFFIPSASFTRGADDSKCQRSVGCSWEELSRGALVGIIEITDCRELQATDGRAAGFPIYDPDGLFAWLVKPLKRFAKPIQPKAHAQPSFFFPFG